MFLNLSDVSCSEIYHEDAARWVSCNTTSTCIMEAWICDGKQDCLDNQDEKNCPSSGTAFTRNNQLLSPCSVHVPCFSPKAALFFISGNKCEETDMFKCKNGNSCIPLGWKCDGDFDCLDKSDEINCGMCYS